MICVQAIFVATGGLMSSQIFKRVTSEWRNKSIVFCSMIISIDLLFFYFVGFNTNSVWLVLFPSLFIGVFDNGANQLISVYTSQEFPGNTEPFALFKLIQNVSSACNILLFMSMSQQTFTLIQSIIFVSLTIWLRYMMSHD